MKKIDEFVHSLYKDVSGDKQELDDLKQEMRSHLIEAVEELKFEGKTEEEAIRMAIENFGGKKQIVSGLSEFFRVQKKFTNVVLSFALLFFVAAIVSLLFSLANVKEYKKESKEAEASHLERYAIMYDVLDVIDTPGGEITPKDKNELQNVFKRYQDKINMIAVFPVKGSEEWLKDNKEVSMAPMNHFPIDYKKSSIIVDRDGIVRDKEHIVPSDYDLGTVIHANGRWIVQYEYKTSYEDTIEKYHQISYYSPNTSSFYYVPITFFSIFMILGAIWLFMRKQNRQLQSVIH
ncbi:permease prefix domain 1-containing protein [Peribacillus deserti]|uniref:Uncharacterized protein n=1 Tax=Peribacillus deserti TaxID=673318 RepID=A0A2N5M885_9BACI|nr:permease prefix domain 1-containing protein [Peribacillus deserti]PLT30591.1 hypothetical protein CUU66_07030 [Peribacillus deserti]